MADPKWDTQLVPVLDQITKSIFVTGPLLDKLVSNGLLDMRERGRIDQAPTEDDKATKMFPILSRGGQGSFDKFCTALKETRQSHLAKILKEAKANCPPPSEATPLKDQGHRAKEPNKADQLPPPRTRSTTEKQSQEESDSDEADGNWTPKAKRAKKDKKHVKVLSLCDEWKPSKGGITTFNRLFCTEGLAKVDDFNVEVCCRVDAYESDDEDNANSANVELTSEMPSKAAKAFKPDVIIGHHQVTGQEAVKVARKLTDNKIPVKRVHFLHTWPEDLERAKKRAESASKATQKEEEQIKLARAASVVAVVGPVLKTKWGEKLDGLGKTVVEVTPGLTTLTEERKKVLSGKRQPKKEISCLLIGRLNDPQVKGLDIVKHAIQNYEGRIKFYFRGIPEDEVEEKEAVLRKDCHSNNIFVKRFDSSKERITDEIATCDLLLMPSRVEAFGLVALEALSLGIPVIASADSGFAEAIKTAARCHLNYSAGDDRHWLNNWILDTNTEVEKCGDTLAKKIYSLVGTNDHFEIAFANAAKLRKAYAKCYTWKKGAEVLLQELFSN